jgi:ubiquitin C-terminal hydrolase
MDGGADLPEAISTFLSKLHDDLNIARPDLDLRQVDLGDQAISTWVQFLSTDNSKIISLFWGMSRQQTRCTVCGHITNVDQQCELFRVFLPPGSSSPLQLTDCMNFSTDWTPFEDKSNCPCSGPPESGPNAQLASRITFL